MSKVLSASCAAGVVTVETKTVASTILSQGTKASTGVVLVEEDKSTYVTSNAVDIAKVISDTNELLTKVKDTLTQVQLCLTALDAVTVSPGSVAAPIALITPLILALTTLNTAYLSTKENLK